MQLDGSKLTAGDNLTRAEFMRAWESNATLKKAELIKGTVYLPSPVSLQHSVQEAHLGLWLTTYYVATPGSQVGQNATLFLLDDAPQPDLFLRVLPESGGTSRTDGDYLAGPPELLVEICSFSASYDLHQKFDLYQEAGVQEYLAIILRDKQIRWHSLKSGVYELIPPAADGVYRSRVFPGLWLDSGAHLDGELGRVLACLQEGIASPQHADFVRELAKRKSACS